MRLKPGQTAILRALSNDRYEYKITRTVTHLDSGYNVRYAYVGQVEAKFEERQLSDSYVTKPFETYKEVKSFLFTQSQKEG